MFVGECRWACTHEHKCLQKLEERALDPLELELQAVVSHLLWLLEVKLLSCKSAMHSELQSHPPAPFCVCLCVHMWHVQVYVSA